MLMSTLCTLAMLRPALVGGLGGAAGCELAAVGVSGALRSLSTLCSMLARGTVHTDERVRRQLEEVITFWYCVGSA